ncbi:MAG TPA: TOBE domain-containing protein, partial [Chryseolinea sp.]|nr:TOBE domain-containing protein [Chryseolinea sp.]
RGRGSPQNIYHAPRNAYVASLLGTYTTMNERTPGFGEHFKGSNQTGTHFVRPESLHLGDRGVRGRVLAVRFLGNHYEVDVMCGTLLVTVLQLKGGTKVGDEVKVEMLG